MPTASAVVADMIDTAVGRTAITFRTLELWSERQATVEVRLHDELMSRYYLRMQVLDEPGVLAQITGVLGRNKISISSLIQHEPAAEYNQRFVPLVIMTHEAPEGAARTAMQEIEKLGSVTGTCVRLRVVESSK